MHVVVERFMLLGSGQLLHIAADGEIGVLFLHHVEACNEIAILLV